MESDARSAQVLSSTRVFWKISHSRSSGLSLRKSSGTNATQARASGACSATAGAPPPCLRGRLPICAHAAHATNITMNTLPKRSPPL